MAIPDGKTSSDFEAAISQISAGSQRESHQTFVEHGFFAHYTSASSLKAIADSRSFLMRNTRLMNDHSEVRHGFELVRQALDSSDGEGYLAACEGVCPGASKHLPKIVAEASKRLEHGVFVLSLCEHHEPTDADGKLSMWRAYGDGDVRVALIARPKVVLRSMPSGILATPVLYGDLTRVRRELGFKAEVIIENRDVLGAVDRQRLTGVLIGLLVNFAVSVKHAGFVEENEWRLIYMPEFQDPEMEKRRSAMVIDSVPQVIYKLPFLFPTDQGYDPSTLMLEKVILGPSPESHTVRAGLVGLVASYGFDNAEDMVTASTIPYRRRM